MHFSVFGVWLGSVQTNPLKKIVNIKVRLKLISLKLPKENVAVVAGSATLAFSFGELVGKNRNTTCDLQLSACTPLSLVLPPNIFCFQNGLLRWITDRKVLSNEIVLWVFRQQVAHLFMQHWKKPHLVTYWRKLRSLMRKISLAASRYCCYRNKRQYHWPL